MTKTLTWLLAGAAMTFVASAALAAEPQGDARTAVRQAEEDAQAAAQDARDAARESRHEHRDVQVYRRDGEEVTIIRDGGRAEGFSEMLRLRPEQAPALTAFLEATRPPHHEHLARADHDEARSTMQKLDDVQARLTEQQADMTRKIAAVKAFYGQLDEQQKKAFDAMPMVMVAGPNIGPIMVPHAMPIVDRDWPTPPPPPRAPRPPQPPGM